MKNSAADWQWTTEKRQFSSYAIQGAAELASGCLLYWNPEILCFSNKAMNAFQDFEGLDQQIILWFC